MRLVRTISEERLKPTFIFLCLLPQWCEGPIGEGDPLATQLHRSLAQNSEKIKRKAPL